MYVAKTTDSIKLNISGKGQGEVEPNQKTPYESNWSKEYL